MSWVRPLRGIHVSSSGWPVYCLWWDPWGFIWPWNNFYYYFNATDVGKIVGTQQLVLLLESRFGCYLGWGDHLRIFHLFRLFFSIFLHAWPDADGCFLQFYFLLTGKKKKKSGVYMCEFLLDWNWICSFFMLVLISLDNNALTVQFLVDRQGTITFGFF
jgi:hypothetical protein